jgi:GNAT superfamily N-acetyltransferase
MAAVTRMAAAVVALTGHHVIATQLDKRELESQLDPHDIAAPFNPAFLAWLGQRLDARVGHVDVTLARLGGGDSGSTWLEATTTPPDNERVRRANRLRTDVRFYRPRDGQAIVTLGKGLAGRCELAMEIDDEEARNRGVGRRLVEAAVGLVPSDESVFAAVAPGNARSLRALLAAGFRPIGAECLLTYPHVESHRSSRP